LEGSELGRGESVGGEVVSVRFFVCDEPDFDRSCQTDLLGTFYSIL
jgi:hypothetical protein